MSLRMTADHTFSTTAQPVHALPDPSPIHARIPSIYVGCDLSPPDRLSSPTRPVLFPHPTGSLPSPDRFSSLTQPVLCPASWIFLFTSRLSHSMSQPHGNHQTGYGGVPLYSAQHHHAPPSVSKSGSEIYPLGRFSPGMGHPNSYVGPNLFGNPAQAPTCSRGISASPHDYQSFQNSSGFPVAARGNPVQLSHSPASHSNYSGHIGPQGHHSQVLFLQSPLERAAPPTQLLQSTPQGSPFKYTFSSPLPGRNPSFQFSAPSVSKPPPKKRAPRRKAPSRPCAKDVVPPEPTPAAPAEINSAETQMRIPLSDAP
ncbi:hypothetical protein PtA15_4A453 [Puccinia triticina]|uniref:Uncharacterized protein n=1 Tax=Puccinia triticina TaxID=208348 RepID=A0ABY7CJ70_9BASI|nr:uncharacterized protein PtA15_4A453 [Puccinia triticina]WAQ84002.1 hypothetical protein PtA15_4A453 [Puccinia triticina]